MYLGWFVAQQRNLFEQKTVVELGAGCGLSGLVASKICKNIAITDGNEHVLELIHDSVKLQLGEEIRMEQQPHLNELIGAKLIWGSEESFHSFRQEFQHPVDIVIGADVVCWPQLLGRLLQTVKALLQTSTLVVGKDTSGK